MESIGVLHKEEWEYSLTKMFSGDEEADCMLHFLQNFGAASDFLATGEATHGSGAMFEEDALFYSSENPNPNLYLSQEITDSSTSASNYSSVCFPNYFSNFNYLTPLMMNEMIPHGEQDYNLNGNVMQDDEALCLNEKIVGTNADGSSTDLVIKRKFEELQQSEAVKDNAINTASDQNLKKKSRVPRDVSTALVLINVLINPLKKYIYTLYYRRLCSDNISFF